MALGNDLLNERRPLRLEAVRRELCWMQTKQVEQGVGLCSTPTLRHRGWRQSRRGHTHEIVIHAQRNVENPTVHACYDDASESRGPHAIVPQMH